MKTTPHIWTDEQKEFVRSNIKGTPYKTMWKMFNEHFGTNLTFNQMHGFLGRNKLKNGYDARFQKGQESWNKGKKGLQLGGESGWFKKGQQPINYRPVGSERIDSKDGYIVMKVQDEGAYQERWKHKHVVVWEKQNGKVPENHVIAFLDNDKTNTDIDNLVLLSRSELVRMNQNGYFSSDPEITKAGIALVKLNNRVNEIDLKGGDSEEFKNHIKRAAKNGIKEVTFMARLKRGWSLHDAVNKPLHSKILR